MTCCPCYSTLRVCFCAGKPTTPAPPTPEVPPFISVVLGSAGQSCTALCQGAGRRCAQEHLAALNNCNILRQHFACEAGCASFPELTCALQDAILLPRLACVKADKALLIFECHSGDADIYKIFWHAAGVSQTRLHRMPQHMWKRQLPSSSARQCA